MQVLCNHYFLMLLVVLMVVCLFFENVYIFLKLYIHILLELLEYLFFKFDIVYICLFENSRQLHWLY